MDRSLKRLERVLELEKLQGYQNKAVVGGIRQFAVFWVTQANEEAADEADRALAEQVSEVLMEYGRLSGVEARARAIDSLLASIERRRARRPEVAAAPPLKPTPPPAKPTPPPAPAPAGPRPAAAKPAPQPPRAAGPAIVAAPADVDEGIDEEPDDINQPALEPELPVVAADPHGLTQPLTALKGVGQKIAEKLSRLGPTTIWELLYLFPRRYDDYTLMKPISKLQYGEQVTVIGTIWQTRTRRTRANQAVIECIVNDGTGTVQATWFNQPWLAEQLPAGMQIVLSGKVDAFLGRLVFNSPDWEPLELEPLRTRRIVPIYPLTEGLTASKMREVMQRAVRDWSPRVPDPLPVETRKRRGLYSLAYAIQQMHFPDSHQALRQARQRLAFDELFLLQLGVQRQRRDWLQHTARPLTAPPERFDAFQAALPFGLTARSSASSRRFAPTWPRPGR